MYGRGRRLLREKKHRKSTETFVVNNFAQTLKGVRKFCTCFLWYFVQSLICTTENMCSTIYSLRTPNFCVFSVLKYGIVSSAADYF